jgi:hypothetical protein
VSRLAVAAAVAALVLTACGRVPIATAPSPDVSASPEQTPVAAVTPSASGSAKPIASTPSPSPHVSPSSSRSTATPSPTFAPLAISSAAFHTGEVRIGYTDVPLVATGGKSPYTWSVGTGALPDGLGLSGNTVGGTPSVAGSFPFSVVATDARGVTATSPVTVNIANYLSGNGTCLKGCSVERLCNAVCGNYAKPIGGVAPFTVTLASGAIPTGTSLGWPALTGQFTTAGAFSFVASVVDALGAKTSVAANFTVFAHIAWRAKTATCGPSYGCTVTIAYSMGTPGGTPTLSLGKISCTNPPCTGKAPEPALNTLPKAPCFTYTVDALKSAVTFSFGSPGTCGDWVGTFVAKITDQSLCGAGPVYCSANITVTVDSETRFG